MSDRIASPQIVDAWLRAKEGVLEESDLEEIERDPKWIWYVCPCGETDHAAARALICEGLSQSPSQVVTCFVHNRQWAVRPVDVGEVIRGEEEKYLSLLKQAAAIVPKIIARRGRSEETFAYLKDTHGIDRDVAEGVLG